MYKVSISFPVYNVCDRVEKSLLSALNQTYSNLEFLIIDDKGTDDSMSIIYEVVSKHERKNQIRFISHKQNLGLGSVRNTSIDYATGEFLYFMDSDDEISFDCISLLMRYMESYRVDFIASSASVILSDGKREKIGYSSIMHWKSNDSILENVFIMHNSVPVYMWNKLFSLEFLRGNNLRCIHSYVEDDFFTFRCLCSASSCLCVPDQTYNYMINGNSITNNLMKKNIPLKTALIYEDIFLRKLELIQKIANRKIRNFMLYETVNIALIRIGMNDISDKIDYMQKKNVIENMMRWPTLNLSYFLRQNKRVVFKVCFMDLMCLFPLSVRKALIIKTNNYRISK